MMADKSAKKTAAAKERERKRAEADNSKRRREEERVQAETQKITRREEREAKKVFDALWTPAACAAAGQRLHDLIKHAAPRNESFQQLQIRALSTPVCRQNMKIAVECRRRKKAGLRTCDLLPLTEPLCAHRGPSFRSATTSPGGFQFHDSSCKFTFKNTAVNYTNLYYKKVKFSYLYAFSKRRY